MQKAVAGITFSAVNPIQQNIRCYTNKTVKSLGESQSNSNADYLVVHPVNMLSSTGQMIRQSKFSTPAHSRESLR